MQDLYPVYFYWKSLVLNESSYYQYSLFILETVMEALVYNFFVFVKR